MKDDKKIKIQIVLSEQEKTKLDSYLNELPYSTTMSSFVRQLIAEKIEKNSKAT